MKILITGGAGFLGINLVRCLLIKGGFDIMVLDIADFDYPEKDRVSFIKGDIRDRSLIKTAVSGVDVIVHAAAALPLYSEKDILTTDIDGTSNVLDEALENHVGRVVHISSTAVYGIPDHHPILETDRLSGVGPYGKAKIEAEGVCSDFRKKGLCVSILRPKSFIGPERLGVFDLLFDWASEGRNFPMIGNGNNRYQLLDVEDLCQAIFLCIKNDKNTVNDVFNIGAREFNTIKNDYQAVLDHAGFGKKIMPFPAGPMIFALKVLEFMRLSPIYKWVYETAGKDSFVSIDKACKVIGYSPKYSNKDALIRNYDWYVKNKSKFRAKSGISHRVPWKQGILGLIKRIF